MTVIAFGGKHPVIDASVFVAPSAAVIGEVTIGANSSVWFGCVIRADVHFIRIGRMTNIQDGTIIHVSAGTHPTIIGDGVTVGHGCILHGCAIGDGAMIGIGATVLDGARVEAGAMIAAGALVTPNKIVPSGEAWAGSPAKKWRAVSDAERAFIGENAPHYAALAARYRDGEAR